MSDLFDEVLNEEKVLRKIDRFRRVLPIIIVLTIMGAVSVGFYSWSLSYKQLQNQATGDLLVDMLLKEEVNDDILNKLSEQVTAGQKDLIALIELSHQIKQNPKEIDFEKIINNANNQITANYAKIMWLNLRLRDGFTQSDKAKALEYFDSFRDASEVFYFNAVLLKSFFYLKDNQPELALQESEKILKSEQQIPALIREQARAIISSIKKIN